MKQTFAAGAFAARQFRPMALAGVLPPAVLPSGAAQYGRAYVAEVYYNRTGEAVAASFGRVAENETPANFPRTP